MQGSLAQIQLPEILQFLSMGKGSGLLTLSRGGQEIVLHVRHGRIINSSSIERQRRLGELLIQRGILRRSTLSEVLRLQRTVETDKRVGQILVERDYVTEQQIREVLRLQLEEEIWNLFAWEEGEFRFEAVEADKLGDAIVGIDIEPLILEGTRRHDEWKKIQKTLPDDHTIVSVKKLGDEFKRELKLSPTEWRVLAALNGKCSVRAVINRSAMGRFEVFNILYQFVRKGILEVRAPQAAMIPVPGPGAAGPGVDELARGPQKKASGGPSLLSLLGGGKKDKAADHLDFISPVGALSAFINAAVEALSNTKDYRTATAERNALDRMWRDLTMTFTRADLVVVRGNHIDASRVEAYFAAFEFSAAIQDTYEDSMEALFNLLDLAYRMFASRMGERQTMKIVRETLNTFSPRVRMRHGGQFNLEDRVQAALKLAA
ncbi:MAG: DUF4388 domain-containing protein [Candidatus Sumerlaeia bacterium]|nr:DUF4388 domain-containing protein [Candidatus Sumerlaeia bacterium]